MGESATQRFECGCDVARMHVIPPKLFERGDQALERRGAQWDVTELPVPVDVLVYIEEEWDLLGRQGRRFYRTVMGEEF